MTNKELWEDWCDICQKTTLWRYLDCAECKSQGTICNMCVCTECGDGYPIEK